MNIDPSPATLFPVGVSYTKLPTTAPSETAYIIAPAVSVPNPPAIPTLVVFLNGLDIPMSIWHACLRSLIGLSLPGVSLLAYDRLGQGLSTDRHPKDALNKDQSHGHDLQDAVIDLKELIEYIVKEHFSVQLNLSAPEEEAASNFPRIVLVAHSIACQLAQLFTQCHPRTVSGLLFLDPSPQTATGDFTSLIPDPDSAEFSEEDLPEGVTIDGLKATMRLFKMMGNDVGSAEGLTKNNLPQLLPIDTPYPKLVGRPIASRSGSKGPFLTLLTHSPTTFTEQQERLTGIPQSIHRTYTLPFWVAFCARLGKITDHNRVEGPNEVEGTGHLIMADNPNAVVREIRDMVEKVEKY